MAHSSAAAAGDAVDSENKATAWDSAAAREAHTGNAVAAGDAAAAGGAAGGTATGAVKAAAEWLPLYAQRPLENEQGVVAGDWALEQKRSACWILAPFCEGWCRA